MTDTLDRESLARALWDHEEDAYGRVAESQGDRRPPLEPWSDQPAHFQEEFHAKVAIILQDIGRQGFDITKRIPHEGKVR